MASGARVRVEERIKINIGEAKNLPSRSHGSVGSRDVFCTVNLDQEQIHRTNTVEKTLNPFFGDEYNFDIPRKFRWLCFYIYDRERSGKQDKVLGKVAVKKEDLHKYYGKDHWFEILPVDCDSEVQGEVHLEIRLESIQKSEGAPTQTRLSVRVIECNGLTKSNGACDPHVNVSLWCENEKLDSKRTRKKTKTTCPKFDETFYFEMAQRPSEITADSLAAMQLRVTVWHESTGIFGNLFLGEVRITLTGEAGLKLNPHDPGYDTWYFLQPRENNRVIAHDLGSLRVKLQYTSDQVISSKHYDQLLNLILQSPGVQPVTCSAVYILGEVAANKQEAAEPLVRIFLHHGKIVSLIESLAEWEIAHETHLNTIFRGNTLVSKCMDELMKLAGLHYLHTVLKPVVERIAQEKKPCEVDPGKIGDAERIDANLSNLKDYIRETFAAIINSAYQCPSIMCRVFFALKRQAKLRFPDNQEVQYCVLSGFVFLRFFAPALLSPKLFDLTQEQLDPQTSRTLKLISKTINSLGSCVGSRSAVTFKEEYMTPVNQDFFNDSYLQKLRLFLDVISTESAPHQALDSPIILKEGVLVKRAMGRRLMGLKNFRQRYFCLTTRSLTYAAHKGQRPLHEIPVDNIRTVELVDEAQFKKKNMFKLVQPDKDLYIQANNCVDQKAWVDILSKVCAHNQDKTDQFHPGQFRDNIWTCCRTPTKNAIGCAPVTADKLHAEIKLAADSDREMERVYALFAANLDELGKLKDEYACKAVYLGDPDYEIQDTEVGYKTINSIVSAVISLEQEHRDHSRSLARGIRYGSRMAPIGDDNYLQLRAAAASDSAPHQRRFRVSGNCEQEFVR
ncbi:ras GTPase-activating protein 3-like [Pollicipes pollicipes]|uniref:ras GTPase-activating protein 3-like n=1 Tax=Pollicipes pollicipes TaxID=41117 RepID=UPI001884A28C|nr:ras GTPase-activating protein 3-like [Pollicipes pollicipes]